MLITFFIMLVISFGANAQYNLEKVIVSSQTDSSSKILTSSTNVIELDEIEKEQQLIDVLRKSPGIHINQSGAMGSISSIHIRGSEYRHVVVLIDGVRIYDPSSTDRIVDLSFLNINDIEKVEVLKGAQGLLYGADAIGGVINIITKKSIAKTRTDLKLTAGNINSIASNISYSKNKNSIFFNANLEQSEIISAASGGSEKDGYVSKGATLSWTNFINNLWPSTVLLKVLDSDADIDAGAFLDDPTSKSKRTQKLVSWKISYEGENNQFENIIALNQHERKSISSYGEFPFTGSSFSEQLTYSFNESKTKYLLGLRFDNESMKAQDTTNISSDMIGAYGQLMYQGESYFSNVGIRGDFHNQFGSVTSLSLGVGKDLGQGFILKSNFATGFKPPSLYQLYGNDFGSCKIGIKTLRPELSESAQISLTKNNLEFSVFSTKIEDFIDHNCNDGYSNISRFKSEGIEFGFMQQMSPSLNLKTSLLAAKYSRDKTLNVARRPSFEGKVTLNYSYTDNIIFDLDFKTISKRYDYIGTKEYVLSPYNITDIAIGYSFKNYILRIKINNIFNETYEDAIGFLRPKLNGNLGLSIKI